MTSALHDLEGLTVTKVREIHGYVQLHFGNEVGISIYNEMKVSPDSTAIAMLVGKTVAAIDEKDRMIEIAFLDGSRITVDMHRQAYRGPEALQLNRVGQPPVIWD